MEDIANSLLVEVGLWSPPESLVVLAAWIYSGPEESSRDLEGESISVEIAGFVLYFGGVSLPDDLLFTKTFLVLY